MSKREREREKHTKNVTTGDAKMSTFLLVDIFASPVVTFCWGVLFVFCGFFFWGGGELFLVFVLLCFILGFFLNKNDHRPRAQNVLDL